MYSAVKYSHRSATHMLRFCKRNLRLKKFDVLFIFHFSVVQIFTLFHGDSGILPIEKSKALRRCFCFLSMFWMLEVTLLYNSKT